MKPNRLDKPAYRLVFLFFIFITIFFPLGFYTLLAGPSRLIAELALKNAWSEGTENLVQKLVIFLLIIVSFSLALLVRRFFFSKAMTFLRYFVLCFLIIVFLISTYFFAFKPEAFIKLSGSVIDSSMQSTLGDSGQTIEFVMGAYPDMKDLKRLKAAGYVGVVSLLNELVVPAEPHLIAEEIENANAVGIELISIPMLPWVSGNNESIQKIQKLAKEGRGKYYVHCYLGRDRVNVFRKIVHDMGVHSQSLQAQNQAVRHIEELPRFERGAYTKLAKDVYLIPYPTEDEFFGYIVNGQFASVVSLLDPKNPEDTLWISKEKNILLRYGVRYINLPVSDANNQKAIKILTDSFPKMKRPIVIHKYASKDPLYKILIQKLGKGK